MTAETRAGLHKDSVECIEIYRKKINKIVELWNNVPNSLDNIVLPILCTKMPAS